MIELCNISLSKLERKIRRRVGKAISDFGMIGEGDKVLVCVSGGKDSVTLLRMLRLIQERSPKKFEIFAIYIDHGFGDQNGEILSQFFEREGVPYIVEKTNIKKIVSSKLVYGKNFCAFCSRMRRGIIYERAKKGGFSKIALGHHKDDFIETLILNIFFTGQIKSMAPKLLTDDLKNIVIRPLLYVDEYMIEKYVSFLEPLNIKKCPFEGEYKRNRFFVKRLLKALKYSIPDIRESIFASLFHTRLSHLLDKNVFNFNFEHEREGTYSKTK